MGYQAAEYRNRGAGSHSTWDHTHPDGCCSHREMTPNSGVQLSFRLDCTAEQPASFYDTLVLFGALGIFVLFKGTIWHVVYFYQLYSKPETAA